LDVFVNGPFLPEKPELSQVVRRAKNAITLFVSATPYNLQTRNAQVEACNEHDMLDDHIAPSAGGGFFYYGLTEYISRSKELERKPDLKERGGYLTKDIHYEDSVKNIVQRMKKDPALTALPGNDDFIRTKSRGVALVNDYQAALTRWLSENFVADGNAAALPHSSFDCSDLTFRMVCDMLDAERRAMILLRVKVVNGESRQGRDVCENLQRMQEELGLVDRFAIILAASGETAQKNGIKAALQERSSGLLRSLGRENSAFDTVEELHGVPCIYIVCESGRMGDTFPRSMLHYDLRLRYDHGDAKRASFEQDLGRAFRYANPDTDVLPTIVIGPKGYEQVMKQGGLQEALPDQNMKPVRKHWQSQQHEKGSSADYRANYVPAEGHFDQVHINEANPPWQNNPRRFLLIGRPQIGKTGVILWLAWLLHELLNSQPADSHTLAEMTVDVRDLEDVAEEEDEAALPAGGNKFPTLGLMASIKFQHPPRQVGGYGDLQDPGMWRHYLGRFEEGSTTPLPKPPPYKPGEGFKKRSETQLPTAEAESVIVPAAESVAGSKRSSDDVALPTEPLTARWLSRGPKEPVLWQQWEEKTQAAKRDMLQHRRVSGLEIRDFDFGSIPKRMQHGLSKEVLTSLRAVGGNVAKLHITSISLPRWMDDPSNGLGRRLAYLEPSDDQLSFPILTPSAGRASNALLDLSGTMVDVSGACKGYVQIVCVKSKEAEWYMVNWPEHSFLVMPRWADELGVGVHRFFLKRLAEAICPTQYRFGLMIDDNVQHWVGITLVDDTEDLFGGTIPTGRNARCRKSNKPMWEALSYLQDPEFTELQHFALLGFQRLGNPRYHNNLRAPFDRSHVYKCYLLNLEELSGRDYDGAVWAVEDVDFNKRLVCDCFPPAHREEGQLCLAAARSPPGRCACWPAAGSPQSKVLCKIRRFGFYSKKLSGGASGTSEEAKNKKARVEPEVPEDEEMPPAALDQPISEWLKGILRKASDNDIQEIASKFAAEDYERMDDDLQSFVTQRSIEQIETSLRETFRIDKCIAKISSALKHRWPQC